MSPDFAEGYQDIAAGRRARSGYSAAQRERHVAAMARNYLGTFESGPGRAVLLDLMQHFFYAAQEIPAGLYTASEWALIEQGQRTVIRAILQAMEAGRELPHEGDHRE
jgi:hypothetical protein